MDARVTKLQNFSDQFKAAVALEALRGGKTVQEIAAKWVGGTSASVKQAFETARRAIIRCGARGFQLPSVKYDQWKDIEMIFNSVRIRIE